MDTNTAPRQSPDLWQRAISRRHHETCIGNIARFAEAAEAAGNPRRAKAWLRLLPAHQAALMALQRGESPAAAALGAKGGKATTEAKAAAARANGKLGGRPRKA